MKWDAKTRDQRSQSAEANTCCCCFNIWRANAALGGVLGLLVFAFLWLGPYQD